MSDIVQVVGFVIIELVVIVAFVATLMVQEQRRRHVSYRSPFEYQIDELTGIRDDLDKVINELRWLLVAKPGDTEMLLQLDRLERWRARTVKRIEPLKLLEKQTFLEAEERRSQMHLVSAA